MLKSGKLKLADDMIVTAQEASNKAETVFTIYDDTTNTEIASGPIGGGGGGDEGAVHINVVNNVNTNPIYYAFNISGSIVKTPQAESNAITIQNGSLMVSAEENQSMNYAFEFDDPNHRTFDAAYNSEIGMYTATIDTTIAYPSDIINLTFVGVPK